MSQKKRSITLNNYFCSTNIGTVVIDLENFSSRTTFGTKKPAQKISVAGFTIRSLLPWVTTLGFQIIASTHIKQREQRLSLIDRQCKAFL